MKHILVPIGTSKNATNTLQYAIDFATEFNAKVFVFRAFNIIGKAGTIINVDEIVAKEQNEKLKQIVDQVDVKSVEVNMLTAKGSVIENINSIHKSLGIDILIIGPRSNDLRGDLFLGKISGSMVKHTNIPVLIIPESYTFQPIKKVLTAIKSGIIKPESVLSTLNDILDRFKAKMHLLQVKTPNFLPEDVEFYSDLSAITSSYNSSENATLFQGVLEHINAKDPDMICVFARKRGFFKKLWEQTTVKNKDFESRVPLLVLKGVE